MAQERMRDIIIQLKAIKESQNLTIQQIIDTLDSENQHLSRSTVVKVFSEGGEELPYQFETIRTLADVMFRVYSVDEGDNPEISGLKSTVQLQNIIIDQLKAQAETEHKAAEETVNSYIRRNEFLRDRVEKQDIRIEQKDRLITIMMMLFLKKFDPDFAAGFGNGTQKFIDDTLNEISDYLSEGK
ncbi:MAG: hypothetical protein IJH64_00685 [Oscillospiraceae bacterium]|nr:hypothetical protein [Oscillospiraceae bacterium]